jgi:protein-tyrosine phosphatase
MTNLMDFHTHILPGIDDGAKDVDVSRLMLKSLADQGATLVCLTPHYYHNQETKESFLEKRAAAYQQIEAYGKELELTLALGSETHLTRDLASDRELSCLCLGQSKLLLLEFPYGCEFKADTLFQVERISNNCGVTPVLAHIERYPQLIKKNSKPLAELFDIGCYVQCNISAFASNKKLIKLLSDGIVNFIGTDCHNMDSRSPDFQAGVKAIKQKLGDAFWEGFLSEMRDRSKRIPATQPIQQGGQT